MKFLNQTPVLLMCIALSVSPTYAAGMEGMQDMPGMMKDTTKATNDQVHKGKGTIEKIDRNKRAITLNHQPIKSMGCTFSHRPRRAFSRGRWRRAPDRDPCYMAHSDGG